MKKSKKGASLIFAIMAIMILSSIMGGIATMGRLSILSGQVIMFTDDIFYIAESGIETGINWIRNYDNDTNWYNNADGNGILLPNYKAPSYTPLSLESNKSIDLSVKYPATALLSDISPSDSTIYVYSVLPFSEEYGPISSESFYIKIGGDIIPILQYNTSQKRLDYFSGNDALNIEQYSNSHSTNDNVYPVTIFTNEASDTDTSISVNNTRGFLPAGTIILKNVNNGNEEYIRYNSKTRTSFIGLERGSNGTTALTIIAQDVTDKNYRIYPIDYEATLISKGTYNGISKTLEVTVQYRNW